MNNHKSQTIESLKVIAHQWRQPLNLISMEAINLSIQATLDEEINAKTILESATRIEEQVQQMSQILKVILNLGTAQRYKKLFSINEMLKTINNSFISDEKNSINLIIEFLNEDKQIYGFETDLQEVLFNLINNAKDAYKEKQSDKKTIKLLVLSNETHFIFNVIDKAGGIPSSIADKIFEQDFSTKITGEGFGIGLYIAKFLIENEFGGTIDFKTSQDGTEFLVSILRNDISNLKFIN